MLIGYNTNGTADHRWADALELMAEIGYRAVAITVDHDCLDPYSPRLDEEIAAMRETLGRSGMVSVVETGARYLLNPRQKHEPTLMSATEAERAARIDFLRRCIDIAAALDSVAVSFWSGTLRDEVSEADAFQRLAAGCREVIAYAADKNVRLAFEPEPGMFIDTMEQYARLLEHIERPGGSEAAGLLGPQVEPVLTGRRGGFKSALRPGVGALPVFGLTLDIGHLHCLEDEPIPVHLRRWKDRLVDVHIEDMRRGVHEHLRFGEGEIDFGEVMQALYEIDYRGPVNVELSRHSHMAPVAMRESYEFLQKTLEECGGLPRQ